MIDAERLQDAITLLPEDLLAPVDALRKRKRTFWKPIAAVAASFLLWGFSSCNRWKKQQMPIFP